MQSQDDTPQGTEPDSDYAAEQTFQAWSSRRLELYRETEQRVQAGVTHMLRLASELTMKMEEETERLLSRYQREREEYQHEIGTLRDEIQQVREHMERERQEHQSRLRQERQQHEMELTQQRQQVMSTIERQMSEAKAQRERLLRDAYAERDRVLEETRQWSTRLSALQQSLQGLLGVSAPAPDPLSSLSSGAPSEQSFQALSDAIVSPAEPSPDPSPAVVQWQSSQELPRSVVSSPEPSPVSSSATTPVMVAELEADALPAVPAGRTSLYIQGVGSIDEASELMDRLEQQQVIGTATLVSYEQEQLVLTLEHATDIALPELVHKHLSDLLDVVGIEGSTVRLRYRP